jgi:hypothetical protein
MAIVAYDKLPQLTPAEAFSRVPGLPNGTPPVDGVSSNTVTLGDLYDPLWGYMNFGQSIGFAYNGGRAYKSLATFTITGTFTITAEENTSTAQLLPATLIDTTRFNVLMAKFTTLEAAFIAAEQATAPASFFDWAGELDPRCIRLPDPLWDKNGNQIWAFPVSLEIQPGRWSESVTYKATLQEAKVSPYKLSINGTIIDEGTLNITLPQPMLARHRLLACAGEVLQCKNYSVLACEATGSMPRAETSTDLLGDPVRDFAALLSEDEIEISILCMNQTGAAQTNVIFPDLDVEQGTGIDIQVEGLKTGITVRSKARY